MFTNTSRPFVGWGLSRRAVVATTTVGLTDRGYTIDATSGTYDIALTAAATLGAGFSFGVYNSGSGVVTINPNGAETIRSPAGSAATLALSQGQGVLVMCDGTGFDVVASTGIAPTAGSVISGLTTGRIVDAASANTVETAAAISTDQMLTTTGTVVVLNATAAVNSLSGAMVVGGGTATTSVGIGGGRVYVGDTTATGSPTSGALVVAGGIGIGGAIYSSLGIGIAGGSISVGAIVKDATFGLNLWPLSAGSLDDFSIFTPGGAYLVHVPTGTTSFKFEGTTDSSSPATGAIINVGGMGVAKRSFLGTIGSTFKGNVNAGVQDATADTAGAVGEVTQGTNQTSFTNFTTTNTYQQLAVLTSLAPGRYRIVGIVTYYGNGATVAAIADATFAISTTTASASGAVEGRSLGYITQPVTSSTHITTSIDTDINISAATSYYLNGKANWTVGNPQWVASITAYRLR